MPMLARTDGPSNLVTVQIVLVVLALASVPVLLLGTPVYLWCQHCCRGHPHLRLGPPGDAGERQLLLSSQEPGNSVNVMEADVERGGHGSEPEVRSLWHCGGCGEGRV
ncbi:putative serine/threonine protein kinase [Platysternon megacephalum]|uniref:Putative serine/threonine protein kinase n=1 Tax=Platysternon megacephalum TaxID=55544 RepID=A0A4D9DDR0_9SAUR|nr:putative serine/threonine protein kinase [Platysternon megacephalum]